MYETTIGLENGADRKNGHNKLQAWLVSQGLSTYLPQLGATRKRIDPKTKKEVEYPVLRSYNLASQFVPGEDGAPGRLDWPREAVEACLAQKSQMVGYYGNYHYNERPETWRWAGVPQDDLNFATLALYMKQALDWLHIQGLRNPWFMVDEPPPEGSDRAEPGVVERVYKMVVSATAAGWTVGIAVPGPSQLLFWAKQSFPYPVRWILNAKHDLTAYEKGLKQAERNGKSPEIWLYNAPVFDGLRDRLTLFGASGYLQWSTEPKEDPLADVGEDSFTILPRMNDMIRELQPPAVVTLENVAARLTALERQVFGG